MLTPSSGRNWGRYWASEGRFVLNFGKGER